MNGVSSKFQASEASRSLSLLLLERGPTSAAPRARGVRGNARINPTSSDTKASLIQLKFSLLTVGLALCFSTVCCASDATFKPLEFPPSGSAHLLNGELVTADFIHRAGQFRDSKTGELHDFIMQSVAAILYNGAEADLRDVPLGTPMRFHVSNAGNSQIVLATDEISKNIPHIEPSNEAAAKEQRKNFIEFTKKRGVPGWIDKSDGNTLTITFFSGDPSNFKTMFRNDFVVGKDAAVCVANAELRTWNPGTDKEKATIVEIQNAPTDCYGCSGVRLVVNVPYMLEGFRRGRCVRVFGSGWPVKDSFYGESLMGYGYGRLQTTELMENVAKDYPDQFPFRTDYGNEKLPWFQLKTGIAPPPFAEHLVFGELVKADAAARTGQFRTDRSGEVVDFALIPEGEAKYLDAKATLADIPGGTRCRFHLFQDEKGAFTKASLVSDEFSFLATNGITYRIEASNLSAGKLNVARQIPETKNYNGDMERIPDIGRTELRVNESTRVWKNDQQVKLSDLAVGDALLINLTSEQKGSPSRCTDIWIGVNTHKLATESRKPKPAPKKK